MGRREKAWSFLVVLVQFNEQSLQGHAPLPQVLNGVTILLLFWFETSIPSTAPVTVLHWLQLL